MTNEDVKCPECEGTEVVLMAIHHEIVAELHCTDCGHDWSEG